jgi:hypothetical protein
MRKKSAMLELLDMLKMQNPLRNQMIEKEKHMLRISNVDFSDWIVNKGYRLNQVVGNSIMWFRSEKSIGVNSIELHNQYIKELEDNFENTQVENQETDTEKYVVMVEGRTSPTKIHDSYETAEYEAKRLCLKERLPVYICKAVAKVELNEVTITKL